MTQPFLAGVAVPLFYHHKLIENAPHLFLAPSLSNGRLTYVQTCTLRGQARVEQPHTANKH